MLVAKNKKAFFDHEITEKFTAGIKLQGFEVKAARNGNVNFDGSYIQIMGGIPVVLNMYIGHYSKQSQEYNEHDARKTRKLLLKRREIEHIQNELSQKGKTAIPLALILENNLLKLEIGIAKGRKKAEKKHVEKERQIKRDLEIMVKENFRN